MKWSNLAGKRRSHDAKEIKIRLMNSVSCVHETPRSIEEPERTAGLMDATLDSMGKDRVLKTL